MGDGGVDFVVEFVVRLKMSSETWRPAYRFPTKRVALERCDILEVRIRDLEDALKERAEQQQRPQTRVEVVDAKSETGEVCLCATSAKPTPQHPCLTWGYFAHGKDKTSSKVTTTGTIRFSRAGTYRFALIVNHCSGRDSHGHSAYKICKNGGGCQPAKENDTNGGALESGCQSLIMKMEKSDGITVKHSGTSGAAVGLDHADFIRSRTWRSDWTHEALQVVRAFARFA